MGLRTRLALVTAGLMAVVLAAAGGFLYFRLRADLLAAVDTGLRSRAATLVDGRTGATVGGGAGLVEPDDAFAQVLDGGGDVVESSAGLVRAPLLDEDEIEQVTETTLFDRVVRTVEEPVPSRLLAVPAGDGRVLVVGASLDDQQEALTRLAILLGIGGPVVLALIALIGWWLAGAALRPVERMRSEAAAISASEPGRRLPVPGTGDELAGLGETLNEMLDRLEQALDRERGFVDEASHELRTPLANLRAEIDLALRRARKPEELEAALRSAGEETDRLVRLAEDLLVLARADRGRIPVRREHVEVDDLLRSTVEPFAARAAAAGVSLDARAPADLRARVDPVRVGQALGNLVDNALRHTSAGGRVSIEGRSEDGAISLEIRDTGEGFPPGFLARAFEPFARTDRSRSRPDRGGGLGLAIVRAVAEAHGGSVEAANRPDGGASVILRLPA
jgi:two-component system, OmpR family, sensor kinase